jgi:hypothetical protein
LRRAAQGNWRIDQMDMWGLILSGIGAVLIAAGQELVASVTAMWLRAHESFLGSLAAVTYIVLAG